MKKTTFKPQVSVVLQITGGQTIDALVHEGKVYVEYPMPLGVVGESTSDAPVKTKATAPVADEEETDDAPVKDINSTLKNARAKKAVEKEEEAVSAKKVASKKSAEASQVFTEEELMETDEDGKFVKTVAELTKICKDRGIKIPAEGKNTNKKLRLLILDWQDANGVEAEEIEEEEEIEDEAPVKKSASKKSAPVEDEEEDDATILIKIFGDFDEVIADEKETIAALVDFGYSKADAKEVLADFQADTDTELEDFVASLLDESEEEETEEVEDEEESAPVPAKRGGKKASAKAEPKETLVKNFADLAKGDRVKAYFESEEDYFFGTVSKSVRGKVTVDYDDDTTDVLDKSENSKVFLLEE